MITGLDHLVLTTTDEDACVAFYVGLLGMTLETFDEGRKALRFGRQKINLHVKGREIEPKAHLPVPGSLDLCFLTDLQIDQVVDHLTRGGVTIIAGPVRRTGAAGPLASVYLRDPDLNLIEISQPESS